MSFGSPTRIPPQTIHVVPVTSNVRRDLPTEVHVSATGLDRPSVAQCHLPTTVSVRRVGSDDLGNVGPAALAEIRSVLALLLDIP